MTTMVLLAAYFVILGLLALFGVHRIVLCWWARPSAGLKPLNFALPPDEDLPHVLVQLPLFNEMYVAERIIDAAAALDYPYNRLQIQVLDDSTDESRALVERKIQALAAKGIPIHLVRRPDRIGYKAGALAFGLKQSSAEYVAIFDADFVPEPDFLKRTLVDLLNEPSCGLVQARWGHLNRDASLLTRAQAVFLDGHFAIEHRGRNQRGRCFNFNGTAGIWRRKTIDDAGGWRSETITEDFDLSYRAQLKGWKFKYRDDIVVPAELPQSWRAFRSQQARWTRGSIETCRLLLKDVVCASQWTLAQRVEAVIHLTSNLTYLLMAALGTLLPATVVLRDQLGWRIFGGEAILSAFDFTMLTAGTLAMLIFYIRALQVSMLRTSWKRFLDIPIALCLGAGLSLGNSMEVIRGFVSKNSEFVRTPKRGHLKTPEQTTPYKVSGKKVILLLELLFSAYYLAAIVYAMSFRLWAALPFLLLYLLGFLFMSIGTVSEGELDFKTWKLLTPSRPRAEHP
jgi:cellulose synthase/poly-beta-1,6-N-acetylglucosamine synthase-like glycosyltransferase